MSNEQRSWFDRMLGGKKPQAPDEHEAEYRANRDQGLRELAAGRVEEAIKALGRALHLRPNLAEAHLNMGQVFQRAGKIEAARQVYLRAIKIDAACTEARLALASLPPGREDFKEGQVLIADMSPNSYKVLKIKKGGFGAVYIVENLRDGERYALKTFQSQYLWNDEDRERFDREAVTWVMLDRHPNIVTVHWAERIECFPCLVLEYVRGGDLATLLGQGPLAVERALELALQFCDGMEYAHRKLGIVHRDVKPANCLLTEDGTLKVTDFGLARAFGEAQERLLGLTGLGMEVKSQYTKTLGTRQFMAPEQFRTGVQLDTRTDIYAFGIMLYQMLTCDLPLSGSIAHAHIRANAAVHQVPSGLLQLILHCVEPDAERRPASFAKVRKALEIQYCSLTRRTAPSVPEPLPLGDAEWNNKGMALEAIGCYHEAIACFDRGLELNPRDANQWRSKGNALHWLGRYEEAIACYERIRELDSAEWANSAASYVGVLVFMGQYEKAIAHSDEVLKLTPKNSILWLNKGAALHYLGRYEEAIACYNQTLTINPHYVDAYRNKMSAYMALGRNSDVMECIDLALKIMPRDASLWLCKGEILAGMGKIDEATECFHRGLAIPVSDVMGWRARASTLKYLGRYEEAIECYDRAIEITSQESALWVSKSFALNKIRRHEEAIACCNRGLEINPLNSGLWLDKSFALNELKRYEESITCCGRGLEIAPGESGLWNNKGNAFYGLGRHEEAIVCYDRGLEIDMGDCKLWKNKGLSLQALGHTQEAEECFRRAHELGGE